MSDIAIVICMAAGLATMAMGSEQFPLWAALTIFLVICKATRGPR